MIDLRIKSAALDEIDATLLRSLARDGRTPVAKLARAAKLSAPSVTERLRRLEEAGVIEGYRAQVNPAALGYGLAAYIRIRPVAGQLEKVAAVVMGIEEIVTCERVTGDDCYIAKAHVRSVQDLERVIDRIVPYAQTNTSIIQSELVKRPLPPLPNGAGGL
ncbi:MAG: Lrp/AsnC family transcriptional regulator [Pseudomonadota bacterium]